MKAINFSAAWLLATMLTAATAQTPTATSDKKDASASAPKHSCIKPVMPEKFTSGAQQDEFQRSVETFRTCLMDYRNQMQKIAQVHVEAGNAAAIEFNEYIKELNAANEKK
jgi:hypothetical protein